MCRRSRRRGVTRFLPLWPFFCLFLVFGSLEDGPKAEREPLFTPRLLGILGKKADVDQAICWLTGYTPQKLKDQIMLEKDVETFFKQAPRPNPKAGKITGTVCGVVIEEIKDPVMRKVRVLDKLVDEIVKGKPMDEVLRK